ncbi:hypothetical protein SARC_10580 [Sphaeroforma arctica JP610]|uniref:AMP-binding enzyme C-terminal domain-containing protein n=1 Tax=Sphaeroforma arctica JP610 TaxID=667725 RepID=A0A0L0FKE6_9EUKA|nr:hypothetical protein SARC_10580 [Sphaeroforma arctica JP610]KNC76946.1 hypothetical protein SARC_10580 [Sphaeroforma arctica JP610]|eukprot:XP_014150848.1 hypothetical protein SARC_10580 [Sphaeroforma arctica JP610]
MDDVVEIVEPPVSGAHPFRFIRSIAGRNDALFDYDGVLVQAVYFYSILLVHKSIAESQIRQTPHGCSIHVVQEHGEDKPDTSLVKQAVEKMLTVKGIAQAHVIVTVVEGIPNTPRHTRCSVSFRYRKVREERKRINALGV